MRRSNSESLLGLTESFFQSYLRHTRGASVHTIRAYRDALKLFYLFLSNQNTSDEYRKRQTSKNEKHSPLLSGVRV
jgi:hypothetical protein